MTLLTKAGSKMVFFELRQQTDTIQAILIQSANEVSKQMYKFAASINPESIVLVKGNVKKSPIEITATSVKDAELHITHVLNSSKGDSFILDLDYLRICLSATISARRCSTSRDSRR
jgi:aspartyl/asparaginyl-tRNA synthetase